jgi:hypothetical protein
MDKPHSKYLHLSRFDPHLSGEKGVSVVKGFPLKELAEQESSGLTEVNRGKPCTYAVQSARFVESL